MRRTFFVVVVLILLWLVAWLSARFLIVRQPLEHADAIVVLSGSSTLVERAQHAAKLYAEHRAPTIILTTDNQQGGWSQALQRNPYSYERTAQELVKHGVPIDSIQLVQPPIYSTWDEAKLIQEYATQHNFNSILIVTSAYHSRRALWTFRKTFGTSSIQIGIDPVVTGVQTPAAFNWFLFPSGWQFIVTEYVKLVYYLLRGLNNSPTAFWYGSRIKTFRYLEGAKLQACPMPIHSILKQIRVFPPVLAVLFLVGACVSTTKADPLFFKNVTAFQNNNLTQVDLFTNDGTTLFGPKLNFSVDIYGLLKPGDVDTLRITYLEDGSAPQVQEFQIPVFGSVQPPFTLFFTFTSPGATQNGVSAVLILDLLNSFPDFEVPGRQGERSNSHSYSFSAAQVPEPVTVLTFGSGLVALGYRLRRRKKY